jgi:hypothetical protein
MSRTLVPHNSRRRVTIGPVGPVGRNQAVGSVGRRCAGLFFTLHIAVRFERLIKPQTIVWNISFRRLCGRRGSQLIPERSITTDHNCNGHRASGSRQAGTVPVSNFAANTRAIVGTKPKRQPAIDLETGRRRDLPNEQHLGIPLENGSCAIISRPAVPIVAGRMAADDPADQLRCHRVGVTGDCFS